MGGEGNLRVINVLVVINTRMAVANKEKRVRGPGCSSVESEQGPGHTKGSG